MHHAAREPRLRAASVAPFGALAKDVRYVRSVLLRNGVSPRDAEDLVQEVLLVMWRRRADFDPSRPLRPWLAGIAVKVAAAFRKRRVREELVAWDCDGLRPVGVVVGGYRDAARISTAKAFLDPRDGAPDPEQELAAVRTHDFVTKALFGVPEKLRKVVVLYELDGWPMREVARALGVPLFTAYSRLRMGRQALARSVRRLQQRAAARGSEESPRPQRLKAARG